MKCIGGPFDGDELLNWQRPDDTQQVYQFVESKGVQFLSEKPRHWAMWASDLAENPPPAGAPRLGHYRLDLAAGEAIWVPA